MQGASVQPFQKHAACLIICMTQVKDEKSAVMLDDAFDELILDKVAEVEGCMGASRLVCKAQVCSTATVFPNRGLFRLAENTYDKGVSMTDVAHPRPSTVGLQVHSQI